jgi:hypothetical protein
MVDMVDKQICKAMAKFSNSGKVEDLIAVLPLLQSRADTEYSVDVSLQVVLKFSERCVALLEQTFVSQGWLCLSFLFHAHRYAHAASFAKCFLHSESGHRAFQVSKNCLAVAEGSVPEDQTAAEFQLYNAVFQYMTHALWDESQVVHVLRTENDAYRTAFTFIVNNSSKLPDAIHRKQLTRLFSGVIFHNSLDRQSYQSASEVYDSAHYEALVLFLRCGGLSAFSAVFWTIGYRKDSTGPDSEFTLLLNATCTALFRKLVQFDLSDPVREVLSAWCAKEASSTMHMIAGFYAYLDPSFKASRELIGVCVEAASLFIQLLRRCGTAVAVEQALKFPYSESDAFSPEGTWLYRCLRAACKSGAINFVETVASELLGYADGITWAQETINQFVKQAGAKDESKSDLCCAFPGCEITGTVLCPLRKCARCLSAHYCNVEHQHAHWPTHRRDCVKRETARPVATTPAIAQDAAAQSHP